MLGIDDMESDEISEIHLKFEIISCLVDWATLISRLNPLHFWSGFSLQEGVFSSEIMSMYLTFHWIWHWPNCQSGEESHQYQNHKLFNAYSNSLKNPAVYWLIC
jgi:hypothetical protein